MEETMRWLTAVLVVTVSCVASIGAQNSSSAAGREAPRTSWGDPDLRGVWTWRTGTPLERPRQWSDRETVSEEEAAAFAEGFDANFEANPPLNSELNLELWLDHGTTLTEDRRTSLVIDPPDGRIPRKGRGGPGRQFARFFTRPESYEDRIAQERCIMYTTTPVHSQFNSNLLQLFQTPDVVVIHYEANHDVRVVPLDGRPHVPDQIRQLHGDSRGHWEGDTLVVETTNFRDEYNFQGAGAQYHLVERFTRIDDDTIDYEYTVEDPESYTQPWTALLPLKRTDESLYEYACHEGNRGLELILEGARAEDVADQFVGAFKLASYVAYDQDGRETPTPYRDGLIMYDATGHMSVHLMHGDRDRPQGPLTDADRAAMYASYIAYYGSYTARVSKGVVEHHVDGSLIPSLVGTTQIRHFAFEDDGDTLILMVKNGDRVQGRLRWERYR
jgi:hypothetical protein